MKLLERNKAELVKLEHKHNEDIASSHSADSVKEQFKNSLLLYDDLKYKKHPLVDSNFKLSKNNGVSNASKFEKPLLRWRGLKIYRGSRDMRFILRECFENTEKRIR